jgi:hypothetical protein
MISYVQLALVFILVQWMVLSTLYPARHVRAMIDQPASPVRHASSSLLELSDSYTHVVWQTTNRTERELFREVTLHSASHCICHVQPAPHEA